MPWVVVQFTILPLGATVMGTDAVFPQMLNA